MTMPSGTTPTPTRMVAHARVDAQGRIVIPADIRHALGIDTGEPLTLIVEGGKLRIFTLEQTIRRVQDEVAKYVPPGVSLVDELIAERRAEAAREERE